MINVLSFIWDVGIGGGETRLLNLASTIDSQRFTLSVAIAHLPHPAFEARFGTLRAQFEAAGIRIIDLGLPRSFRPRRRLASMLRAARVSAQAVRRLRRLIASMKIDVVDGHLENALLTAVPAAASLKVPSAVTLYSEVLLWKGAEGRPHSPITRGIRRISFGWCRALITDSTLRAEELSRYAGAFAPPVYVIPNGVRPLSSQRSREEMLRELDIPAPSRTTIIGQIARLVPFKGQRVLLDAARAMLDKGADVYVLCIGYPCGGEDYRRELEGQVKRLGIADRVRIRPYAGNIADIWQAIDIHVHPALIDSLPNALIEGMSLRKPAVVTSVGGIPDHVIDGENGLLVPPDNPTAVADAVLRLLRDRELGTRLGEAAYRHYRQCFTPDVTTRQIERCFEEIVENHRRRRRMAVA